MSSFRRGVINQPTAQPVPLAKTAHIPRARTIEPRIIDRPITAQTPNIIVPGSGTRSDSVVRGVLVDTKGKIIRGLSQATIQAHQAHTEIASELCKTCGQMRPPAEMRTPVGNAYNPSNPLRVCVQCLQFTYKDPNNPQEQWRPQMPSVRFDRERANPYNPVERGLTMKDLTNRDTYHREREVPSEFVIDQAPNSGQWNGRITAGHVVTQASLEQSRERAGRRR